QQSALRYYQSDSFFCSSRRRHTRSKRDWSSDVCSSDLNRTYISFDFYNHENELYRVTREFKRNTKQFSQIRSPKTVFYHAEQGEIGRASCRERVSMSGEAGGV